MWFEISFQFCLEFCCLVVQVTSPLYLSAFSHNFFYPVRHFYKSSFNPFPNKPLFLCVCSTCLLKTMREKAKLLITSNFSCSLSVFYPFGELSANFIEFKIVLCKNPFNTEEFKICCLGKG